MIGTLNAGTREAAIVGGGVSGLLAAYYLDRGGFKVSLFEASDRLGGLIATAPAEHGIAESAAHMILVGRTQRALFDDLGVALSPLREDSRARYIARGGRISRFPLGPREALGAFLRAYFVLANPSEEATMATWAHRHLGAPATEYLVDPFVGGIFGTTPAELSVEAAFPHLAVPRGHSLLSSALSRFRKGPAREKKSICAPIGGMGALISALEKRLRSRLGAAIRTGSALRELPRCANVLLCVPARDAAASLANADAELAARLDAIEYVPLVSVTAFLEREAFGKPPRGIGVLIPSCEKRGCLGILFNSSAFPGRVADESRWVSVTALLGGSRDPAAVRATDEELKARVLHELHDLLGYRSEQARLVIHRWPRAIPKYDERVLEAWRAARQGWCAEPGRVLFGNFTGQVSLRGMMESASHLAASLQP